MAPVELSESGSSMSPATEPDFEALLGKFPDTEAFHVLGAIPATWMNETNLFFPFDTVQRSAAPTDR